MNDTSPNLPKPAAGATATVEDLLAYDLVVTLQGIGSAIWRTLRVPAEITLGHLSDVLDHAFGWSDAHMHSFKLNGVDYGPSFAFPGPPLDEPIGVREKAVTLASIAALHCARV